MKARYIGWLGFAQESGTWRKTMNLHQELSKYLHKVHLHNQWKMNPSFEHALELMGVDQTPLVTKSARRAKVVQILIDAGQINAIDLEDQ